MPALCMSRSYRKTYHEIEQFVGYISTFSPSEIQLKKEQIVEWRPVNKILVCVKITSSIKYEY